MLLGRPGRLWPSMLPTEFRGIDPQHPEAEERVFPMTLIYKEVHGIPINYVQALSPLLGRNEVVAHFDSVGETKGEENQIEEWRCSSPRNRTCKSYNNPLAGIRQ